MKDKNNKKIKAFVLITCLLFVVTTVGVGEETYIYSRDEVLVPLGAGVGPTDSNTHIGGNTSKEKLYENYTGDIGISSVIAGVNWRGQSFTVGTVGDNERFIITRVGLHGYKFNNPGDLTVDLQAVDITGKPTGRVLATGSISQDEVPTGAGNIAWFYIRLSGYKLFPNIKYSIVVHADGATIGNGYIWVADATGIYVGGNLSQSSDGGATWSTQDNFDFLFEVWGKQAVYSTRILGGHIGGG